MRTKKHLTIAFLAFTGMFYAQEKLNLQQAISYALQNNKTVKNAALNIEAAKQQKWETTAMGLPQINGKLDYQHWMKQQFAGIDFNQDGIIDFGAKQNITPSITLSQLIFDGSYIVGLQSAKVFLDISTNAKIKTDKEITKAVTSAYSNSVLIQKNIEILEKNITNIQKNISESKQVFENGLIEEETIEQLNITLNDLQNQQTSLKSIQNINLNYLKLMLGIDSNTTILLTDSIENLTQEANDKNYFTQTFSVFENIDYQIAENDVEGKRLLYQLERARQLPTISGFLTGNKIANSNSFTFFNSSQAWIPTSMWGISMQVPIFTSFKGTARIKRAKFNWEIAQNSLAETQQKLQISIDNAKNEYQLAIQTLENRKSNLNLAEKIENKNNIKFKEGLASSFDLRQAQLQLYKSQQEYLQAMVDVINKKSALQTLTK